MSALSYQADPQIQYLYQLVRDIAAGNLGLPRFQRPFVWTIDQRLELFRSIRAGTPIGSVMIWRTDRDDVPCWPKIGAYDLAPLKRRPRAYIIDGHQRLATLFDALHVPPEGTPLPEQVAFYDLDQEEFRFEPGAGAEPTWLPLRYILDFPLLLQFQRGLTSDDLIRRCDPIVTAFGQYKVPVTTVVSNNLDEVTRAFQRINSQGTQMSEVHMISALTWREDFDLNERIALWKEEHLAPLGWGDLGDAAILYGCKAALGFGIYDDKVDAVSKKLQGDPGALDAAGEALTTAITFLRDQCGIHGPNVLPYPSHIIPLAEAFRRKPARSGGADRDALVRWFWLMAYSGTTAGLAKVVKTLEHLTGDTTEPPPLPLHLGRELAALPPRFDFRTARCRALSIRLAERAGSEGPTILAEHGARAMPHLVLDWALLGRDDFGSPANRIFARPEDAAAERGRVAGACETNNLTQEAAEGLSRHGIPASAALAFDDKSSFLGLRREALWAIEQDFVRSLGLLQP